MEIKFRPLTADEIEVKVKAVKSTGVQLLLYKNARTDMNVLDDCVGPLNWENQYMEVKGNLYSGIGIRDDDGGMVWKWDCGTESREDGDGNEKKGEASDAFKRAGFKWGIGRALYTGPKLIWIPPERLNEGFNGSKCFDRFEVERIAYSPDGRMITGLSIRNSTTGKRVFVWQREPLQEKT